MDGEVFLGEAQGGQGLGLVTGAVQRAPSADETSAAMRRFVAILSHVW